MSLVDSWTDTYIAASAASRGFICPVTIPVGQQVVLAVGRGGGGTVNSVSDSSGNTWHIDGAGPHTGNTLNVALISCLVTTQIDAGDTITIGASAASNRWSLVGGVFDDAANPWNGVGSSVESNSTPNDSGGPTSSLVVDDSLVCLAVATTAGGYPIAGSGATLVAGTVTAAGSSERAVALIYKYETGNTHTIDATLNGSVVSAYTAAAYESVADAPPSGPTATLWDGATEVAVTLSIWDGATEVPVTFELA